MNKFAISFILPIYNVELYLAEAIESILKQEISKEIILVDDGSTDSSLVISLDYANKYPFIYVIHSQNKGVSAARNAGLKLARGEYVMFLDPDDFLHPGIQLNSFYQFAVENNINVIKGQYQKRIGENLYTCLPIHKDLTHSEAVLLPLNTFFEKSLPNDWFMPNACFLLNRTYLYQENLWFNESLQFGEDTLFNVDLLSSQNKIAEVPYIFFVYRKRENSAMTKPITLERLDSQKRMIEILMQRLTKNNPYIEQLKKVIVLNCEHFMHSIENNPQFFDLITAEIKSFSKLSS